MFAILTAGGIAYCAAQTPADSVAESQVSIAWAVYGSSLIFLTGVCFVHANLVGRTRQSCLSPFNLRLLLTATSALAAVCGVWILMLGHSSQILLAQLDRHAAVICTVGVISTLLLARLAFVHNEKAQPTRSTSETIGLIWSLLSVVCLAVVVVWCEK